MKTRKFAIYKHSLLRDDCIWEVHRKYETMKQAKDALRDLIKRPKKTRVYRYTIYPVMDQNARAVELKPEFHEQLLKTAR